MGPLCPCPNSKKAYEKCTRGISWGHLLTPGPRAVPEFPNGQSALEHFDHFVYERPCVQAGPKYIFFVN
ncbi:unnamed protein product [Staurois parvus]|uniref:Uncharacterized protein n=1 Tax=Staurois parvus TaxID=386267 RepID=A0ABN9AGX1_9NEOB|nr:unnamed protein product [Staurois parvus]